MIHPSAVIDPSAELADNVEVGPFSVIGPGVTIGAGTVIGPQVVIMGPTTIGPGNRIHPFASIGGVPQDKKYAGEATRLEIGAGNTIFESVTISRGTVQDEGLTRIGDDNWIMAYVHIAHDCDVGSHTILANCTTLAGHVVVEDWAILGGFQGAPVLPRGGAQLLRHGLWGHPRCPALRAGLRPPGGTPRYQQRGTQAQGLQPRGAARDPRGLPQPLPLGVALGRSAGGHGAFSCRAPGGRRHAGVHPQVRPQHRPVTPGGCAGYGGRGRSWIA